MIYLVGECENIKATDNFEWPDQPWNLDQLLARGAFAEGAGSRRRIDQLGIKWDVSLNLGTPGHHWDFDRVINLASELKTRCRPGDVIITCGTKTAEAFKVKFVATGLKQLPNDVLMVMIPHPSGRTRYWNDLKNVEAVRRKLAKLNLIRETS